MIGGWVLQKAFQEAGFTVPLGPSPQQEFINAAIEIDATPSWCHDVRMGRTAKVSGQVH
jgi:hypothetical protein